MLPSFIITIDTEGDNLWGQPEKVLTKNASYLIRFQELCDKYKFKPTYLTNYEMAQSDVFQELGNDVISKKTGEIGMHLHAWDMPPVFHLTVNDKIHQPYLIEYPENIMRDKIRVMTDKLESVFQTKMLSHRAGRWAFDERYAALLIENGYKVDCSVTPNVSWSKYKGDPAGMGGSDYTKFPSEPYFIDLNDISKSGSSDLLELPMTIESIYPSLFSTIRNACNNIKPVTVLMNRLFPEITWLRPNGRNISHMSRLVKRTVRKKHSYIEFMLHSSEFMPGGSPTFKDEKSIESLFSDLDALFSIIHKYYQGRTLSEFYQNFTALELSNK